ncbi:MAG TPA: zinc ribbon domain-containing protein [Candidatus Thermoplasmatota archaeon]|nr:zinc ribbon domain-containing protein [Candidatus Thermoplasmatota archaeon]
MIEKTQKIENARWVEGDLGLHFVYTAGIAGEEFLRALQKGKVLASTCGGCEKTYCPPRIFCEECFEEIAERHEVEPKGTIVSLTRLALDEGGKPMEPAWVGAIRLGGTDTTLLHRLEGEGLAIGDSVEAVWASKRTGSILDIQAFRGAKGVAARPTGNGGRARVRVARRLAAR